MKALFNFISAYILSNIPAVKTVKMWNNQIDHSNDIKKRDEKPFRYPAVFVEFITEDVENRFSFGIKNVKLKIRFRFAIKHYTYVRLADLDFGDAFDFWISKLRGNPADAVQFTTLQEILTELDEEFENVNAPYADYTTMWRKVSAYTRGTDITVNGVDANVTGVKVISLP